MKKIRERMVNLLFRLTSGSLYEKLKKVEVYELIDTIIGKSEYNRYITFLNQSADDAKNKYVYSDDKIYKGMALAFVMMKETLQIRKREQDKKEVKQEVRKKSIKDGRNPDVKHKVNY